MLVIATQNTSASWYSMFTYQIKFPPARLLNFHKFSNPPFIPTSPPLEEFSNPRRYFNPPSLLLGTQEYAVGFCSLTDPPGKKH